LRTAAAELAIRTLSQHELVVNLEIAAQLDSLPVPQDVLSRAVHRRIRNLDVSVKENVRGDLAKAPVSANQEGQRDPRA
jgi:hypothetical protein